MGEYDLLNISHSLFLGDHSGSTEDDFGSVVADHVNAQDLAVFLTVNNLYNTIAAFVFIDLTAAVTE